MLRRTCSRVLRVGSPGSFLVFAVLGLTLAALPAQRRRQVTVRETEHLKHYKLRSKLLSDFWGRNMYIEAGVVLPPDRKRSESLPVCYSIHGFGGSYRRAWRSGPTLLKKMREGYPRMIYVFLQAQFSLGHHTFADSVNNGPWARALVEEFIPSLEREYGAVGSPDARFLTGHSSGGWSSLWLQVVRDKDFGGTWSTAPDSVDFRDFTGINVYEYDNAYKDPKGEVIQLMRERGGEGWRMSIEDYVRREEKRKSHGGQFQSFDAVFGPRGVDGRPMPMFDRASGKIDRAVARSWRKYDISLILRTRWKSEAAKLAPKIHVFMGTKDTFRLEGALYLMRDELEKLGGPQPTIVFAEGRDHGSLMRAHDDWPDGLLARIHKEMRARFDAKKAVKR